MPRGRNQCKMQNAPRRSSRIPRKEKTSQPRTSRSRSATIEDTRKRRSFVDDESLKKTVPPLNMLKSFSNIQKRVVNGRSVDSYCWICHELADDFICNECPRVYHVACVTNKWKKAINQTNMCECHNKAVDGRIKVWHPADLKPLLAFAVKEAIKEDKKCSAQKVERVESKKILEYFNNWAIIPENDALCCIIDITVLIDKLNNIPPYQSPGHFFSDVKWMYHNCAILYEPGSEIRDVALKLERNFKQELLDFEACEQCYTAKHSKESNINVFAQVCSDKPHPIVWAKIRGSPYWPAKCLKILNGYADVRFFGTHDKANILLSHVYKYSKDHPDDKKGCQQKYKDAIYETELYIMNYENYSGTFQYFKKKTPVDERYANHMKRHPKKGKYRGKPEDSKNVNSNLVERKVQLHRLDPVVTLPVVSTRNITIEGNSDTPVVCEMAFTAEENNGSDIRAIDDFNDPHSSSSRVIISTAPNASGNFSACPTILYSSAVPNTSRNITAHSNPEPALNQSSPSNEACSTSAEMMICSNDDDDAAADEEDVQLINEIGSTGTFDALLKDESTCKALCELLLCNRPNAKSNLEMFQKVTMNIFLKMWLELNHSKSPSDFERYLAVYDKYLKNVAALEEENGKLKAEIQELKKKVKEQDEKESERDLVKSMILESAMFKQSERERQLQDQYAGACQKFEERMEAMKWEMEKKNKEIAEYVKKIEKLEKSVLKSDKECQTDISEDSKVVCKHLKSTDCDLNMPESHPDSLEQRNFSHVGNQLNMPESHPDSLEQRNFSHVGNQAHNDNFSDSQPKLEITETVQNFTETHISSQQLVTHSNLQIQTEKVVIQQNSSLVDSSSNVVCETSNIVMAQTMVPMVFAVVSPQQPTYVPEVSHSSSSTCGVSNSSRKHKSTAPQKNKHNKKQKKK